MIEVVEMYVQICLEMWGAEAQSNLAKEELAELIVAISHVGRNRENSIDDVIEEIADVELICAQMRQMVNLITEKDECIDSDYRIDNIKDFKIRRTLEKIKERNPTLYEKYYGNKFE